MASFCYRIKYEHKDGGVLYNEVFDYLYNARHFFNTVDLVKKGWVRCWIERTDGRIMSRIRTNG